MANKRSPEQHHLAGKGGLDGNVRAHSKSRSIWHFPVLAVAFGGTAILILWTVIFAGLASMERAELASANRGVANLARSFAGHVERSLDGIDQILTVVARAVVERGVPDHLSEILGEGVRNDPLFLSLAVVDPEGGVASQIGAPLPDPVDHDFLLRQRQRPDGGLLVSVPQTGVRSAQGAIQLSERIVERDGSFGGVVVASVAPEFFTRFYSRFDLGEGGSVALVGLDGALRVRYRQGGELNATSGNSDLLPAELGLQIQADALGQSSEADAGRLYAHLVLERYPLAVAVAMTETHVLSGFRERRQELLTLGVLVSAVIATLTGLLGLRSVRLARAEEHARGALEQLRLSAKVFEESSDGIMICDGNNRILTINRAFTAITGYAPDEVVGRNPRFLSSGATAPETYQEMWRSLKESGAWHGEVVNRRKDGEEYPEWLSVCEVRDDQGEITHFIGIFSDATAHKFDSRRLHFLVHYDALTELPNRLLLDDRLTQALAGARRSGKGLAVLFIDLDNFKPVNDTHGHEAGDRLLQAVAARFRSVLRETDTLARLGGDEFVLVVPELDYDGYAEVVAEKCRSVFDSPFVIGGCELRAAASIGIALYPLDGEDARSLLAAADRAMYAAKEAERGATRALTGG